MRVLEGLTIYLMKLLSFSETIFLYYRNLRILIVQAVYTTIDNDVLIYGVLCPRLVLGKITE